MTAAALRLSNRLYFGDKHEALNDLRRCVADLSLYRLCKQCYISLSIHVTPRAETMNALVSSKGVMASEWARGEEICDLINLDRSQCEDRMDDSIITK